MYDREFLKRLQESVGNGNDDPEGKSWRRVKENRTEFTTGSGEFRVERIYTPADTAGTDFHEDVGLPGQYPFTRGITPWATGAFVLRSVFTPDTGPGRARTGYRQLYAAGSRDIGLALDLPTQLGLDSDDSVVGRRWGIGWQSIRFADLERALKGIPLSGLKTGTVGNCIGPWALALFIVLCERTSLPPFEAGVSVSRMIRLRSIAGRGTYMLQSDRCGGPGFGRGGLHA